MGIPFLRGKSLCITGCECKGEIWKDWCQNNLFFDISNWPRTGEGQPGPFEALCPGNAFCSSLLDTYPPRLGGGMSATSQLLDNLQLVSKTLLDLENRIISQSPGGAEGEAKGNGSLKVLCFSLEENYHHLSFLSCKLLEPTGSALLLDFQASILLKNISLMQVPVSFIRG